MRVYELGGSGAIEGIIPADRPIPTPARRQVLVRMRAASLNYRDLMIIDGTYPVAGRAGLVPLSDGAGEVVELGAEVERFKIGDHVIGVFFPRWQAGPISAHAIRDQPGSSRDGMLAEFVLFDEDALVPAPGHLSFEEAATLPCAALTAWVALTGPRPLLPGETVLTQGSGGVSLFALQIAKMFGARVIATTASAEKAERLLELGADEVINRADTPNWPKAVRALTDNEGADHVIEIGGVGTLEKSLRSTKVGGVVNLIGVLASAGELDPGMLMRGISDIRRITVGNRAELEALLRAVSFHRVRPVIDTTFPFADAKAAFRHFHARQHFGKVVISLP